jgi:hypothetical protein
LVESENLRRKQLEATSTVAVAATSLLITADDNHLKSTIGPPTKSSAAITNNSRGRCRAQKTNEKKLNSATTLNPRNKKAMTRAGSNHSNSSSTATQLVIDELQFSKNALFHSPSSLLTKLDLKTLFQPAVFETFPRQSQLKLIKLLPECDRQLDSHGSFK